MAVVADSRDGMDDHASAFGRYQARDGVVDIVPGANRRECAIRVQAVYAQVKTGSPK
ncbi:hypothetical protein SDC9_199389 [bioreactor metagenome]|uniref:Uncharacterized protein n=1 Tax=bioreactor metagenome TaxID=1076179 RepID=A0A645IKW8_9ZZZZ